MSSSFKNLQKEIKVDTTVSNDNRVVKLDAFVGEDPKPYTPKTIRRDGQGSYQQVKKVFGALAATDMDRQAKTRKDARFSLNPLLREPLAVEQEERRVIDERVRSGIASVAEEAKAKAAEAGYQEGLERGYQEAYKRIRREGNESLKKFESFLAECENAKTEVFKANERFLVEMVYRICKTVMLKELSTDQEYVLRLAKLLIERIGVRENIRIRVSPEDLKTATLLKEGLEKTLGSLQNLNIEASAQINFGCKVESEWNAIDATFETQLKGIHAAMVGAPVNDAQGSGT